MIYSNALTLQAPREHFTRHLRQQEQLQPAATLKVNTKTHEATDPLLVMSRKKKRGY